MSSVKRCAAAAFFDAHSMQPSLRASLCRAHDRRPAHNQDGAITGAKNRPVEQVNIRKITKAAIVDPRGDVSLV